MLIFPNAKINLGLRVTEKRNDGFHNIETCFFPVGWEDALEIIAADKTHFVSTGISIPGSEKENLCLKAYKSLNKDFNLNPVEIHLHKTIPIGAGLGGGSSDTTATLMFLNEHFNLMLDDNLLSFYADQLGSDCSFFIHNQPAIGHEKGNVLEPIDLSLHGLHLYIVYPGIHVNTGKAYANIHPNKPDRTLMDILTNEPIKNWKEVLINDFETSVFLLHPELKDIKDQLYRAGAVYASMSGSGSAIYALSHQEITIDTPAHFKVWREIL